MPTTIISELQSKIMLNLMYITNRPEIAEILQRSGVDRVFIDLETIGKAERQGGMDTVQSKHSISDISLVRPHFNREILVRSNPIHKNSKDEINAIIENGADVVMLPFFKSVNEAAKFIDIVGGRAKINLLVETVKAVEHIDAILELDGIDEIHVGLNDLHLDYGMKFMFELLTNGTVEEISKKVLNKNIKFGFGGIARLGEGAIPAERIIKEHYRIGSSIAILSRSFCNVDKIKELEKIEETFVNGIKQIRILEKEAQNHLAYFRNNQMEVIEAVEKIVSH